MKRDYILLGAIALGSMLAGVLLFKFLQPLPEQQPSTVSIELHSIPLTDIYDQQTLLKDWAGEILVVNFWAPWCAPCRREIPALIEIERE